jgi:polyhydroxybutyrate depolymerase
MSRSTGRRGRFRSPWAPVAAALAILASGCGGSAPVSSPAGSAVTPGRADSAVTTAPADSAPVSSPTDGRPATAAPAPSDDPTADRPYEVFVPASYDASVPTPLVLLLHGFGTSSDQMEAVVGLQPVADERGFLYVHPDGTRDAAGAPFWNATDGCCNTSSVPIDDSAYLETVVEQVQATYTVDPKRIYIVGVSNGGFMAHRMACDHAATIAAIVSFAGATFLDPTMCRPSQPVSVLQIHGTADEIVPYDGGELIPGHPFPAAEATVADWATSNRCGPDRAATGTRLDLDATIPGDDTEVSRFDGCPPGGAVELWTITGAGHIMPFAPAFTPSVVDFLLAHPKP